MKADAPWPRLTHLLFSSFFMHIVGICFEYTLCISLYRPVQSILLNSAFNVERHRKFVKIYAIYEARKFVSEVSQNSLHFCRRALLTNDVFLVPRPFLNQNCKLWTLITGCHQRYNKTETNAEKTLRKIRTVFL